MGLEESLLDEKLAYRYLRYEFVTVKSDTCTTYAHVRLFAGTRCILSEVLVWQRHDL